MSSKKEGQRQSQGSHLRASIDIGSNTIRLLVGYMKGNTVERVYADRKVTRLGESVLEDRSIKSARMAPSLEGLRYFKEKAEDLGVEKIIAVGTSALREALNAKTFLDLVKNETGININIITPEEEASLTIEGIKAGLSLPEEFVAFDMGGGSTEFIIKRHDSIELLSIPIGVLKLSGFLRNYPPSEEDISNLLARIKESLSSAFSALIRNQRSEVRGMISENPFPTSDFREPLSDYSDFMSPLLIGTGGTATTIASLDLGLEAYIPEQIHGHRITFSRLKRLFDKLSALPLEDIKRFKGMEEGREDLILPGLLGIMEIMKALSVKDLIVSDYGILEGIIKKEAEN